MANVGDYFKDIWGLDSSALDGIGAIFGTLADVQGAWSAAQLLHLISQDDEVSRLLEVIESKFSELTQLILAEDKLQRIRTIDSIIDPAFQVFRQLPATVSSEPLPKTYTLQTIGLCETALLALADNDDNWQAVAGELPAYSDPWSGTVAPQPGADPLTTTDLVFNYTYTLAQFLRAIYFFLTVVNALDPSSLADYQRDLNNCIVRLQSVHDTILSGIVPTRPPLASDVGWVKFIGHVKQYPTDRRKGYCQFGGDWDGSFGAIEMYSAANIVESYSDYFPYEADAADWSPEMFANFSSLLAMRVTQRRKLLYKQVGLPSVRRVINHLNYLLGLPLSTDRPYEAWSATELTEALRGASSAIGLEESLATVLLGTPPYREFLVRRVNKALQAPCSALQQGEPMPTLPLLYFLTGTSLPCSGGSTTIASHASADSASHHVYYATPSGSIRELWWASTGPDQTFGGDAPDGDLMASTGAPTAAPGSCISTTLSPDGSWRSVFYIAADSQLHQMRWEAASGWSYAGPLPVVAGGLSAAALSTYVWPDGESQHVFCLSLMDGHVRELVWIGAGWVTEDLTPGCAAGEVPCAAPDSVVASHGYARSDAPSQHAFYVGTDGHVQHLVWTASTGWAYGGDLCELPGAPHKVSPTSLVSFASPSGWSQHVLCLSPTDGHIHEFAWTLQTNRWIHAGDLMKLGVVTADTNSPFAACVWPGESWWDIVYRGGDGYLYLLEWEPVVPSLPVPWRPTTPAPLSGAWRFGGNIGESLGAPTAVNLGPWSTISGHVRPDGDSEHVCYASTDGRLHQLFRLKAGDWNHSGPLATLFP